MQQVQKTLEVKLFWSLGKCVSVSLWVGWFVCLFDMEKKTHMTSLLLIIPTIHNNISFWLAFTGFDRQKGS